MALRGAAIDGILDLIEEDRFDHALRAVDRHRTTLRANGAVYDLAGLIECFRGEVHAATSLVNRANHVHRARRARAWPPLSPPVAPLVVGPSQVSAGNVLALAARNARAERLIALYDNAAARIDDGARRARFVARRGQLDDLLGRTDRALAAFESAMRATEGWGSPATDRALLHFRRAGIPATPAHGLAARPRMRLISKVDLGGMVRFGNQIIQYMQLYAFARRFELALTVPDWLGRYLFVLDDPYVERLLPAIGEHGGIALVDRQSSAMTAQVMGPVLRGQAAAVAAFSEPARTILTARGRDPFADFDDNGFFVVPSACLAPERDALLDRFRLAPHFEGLVAAAMARLRERGTTVVALHVRLGDLASRTGDLVPWAVDWVASIWPTLDRPVLYLASDTLDRVRPLFAAYRPLVQADVATPVAGAEFFLDHALLSQADIVGISAGTFSFTAAMLNRRARAFYRPDRSVGAMAPFDPWDDRAAQL